LENWKPRITILLKFLRRNLLAASVAMIGAIGSPQHPTREVQWTTSLQLKNQADVDHRLTKPFDEPIFVEKNGQKATVASCSTYLEYTREGFVAGSDQALRHLGSVGVDCLAVEALKGAVPARRSYLGGFRLDNHALRYLPPSLGLAVSQEDLAKVSSAESKGISWQEYDRNLKVDSVSTDRATVEDETVVTRLQTYATGDFNGDGIEDLLLRVDSYSKQGSYSNCRLLLLTRTSKAGLLRLIKEYK
jgi:hypothetical protein